MLLHVFPPLGELCYSIPYIRRLLLFRQKILVAEWTRVIEREPGAGGNTAQYTSVAILIIADLSRASKNRETISDAATASLLIPASVEETAPVEHFKEADGRK